MRKCEISMQTLSNKLLNTIFDNELDSENKRLKIYDEIYFLEHKKLNKNHCCYCGNKIFNTDRSCPSCGAPIT